jgi:hypothetical protein
MASAASNLSPQLPDVPSLLQNADLKQALHEFHIMLRYALAEGLEIDEQTRMAVGAVEQLQPDTPLPATVLPVTFNQVMTAHGALAKIVAPATPLSLEATEPAPGWLGSVKNPPLILVMMILGLAAAVGFLLTTIFLAPASGGSTAPNNPVAMEVAPGAIRQLQYAALRTPIGTTIDEFQTRRGLEQLNWLFAAALGAVFYVLFTAHQYVKERTFDPRYNSMYMTRFVLGCFLV